MSALAVNSLLENQSGNLANHNLAGAATKIGDSSTMIHRKHYSDSGAQQHHYSHEFSGHPYTGHHKEKKSRNIALTALTLLSFLFFLHILQQCLQDQMDDMNPQVVIMQARIKAARESEAKEVQADKRIGESLEKTKNEGVASDVKEIKEESVFKKAENEYHYEKVHVPVKIRTAQSDRHK